MEQGGRASVGQNRTHRAAGPCSRSPPPTWRTGISGVCAQGSVPFRSSPDRLRSSSWFGHYFPGPVAPARHHGLDADAPRGRSLVCGAVRSQTQGRPPKMLKGETTRGERTVSLAGGLVVPSTLTHCHPLRASCFPGRWGHLGEQDRHSRRS